MVSSKENLQNAQIELVHPPSDDKVDFYGERLSPEAAAHARRIERKARWKVDLMILPLLSSVYILAQMGRSDLGNAKIIGMEDDLELTPHMYSNAASIMLVGYLVFQLPGTLLLRKIGPPVQFGTAMIIWGMLTTCTVEIKSYASLMVLRALIGAAEAFVQGALVYLTFWYTYSELATRGGIYYSTAALAGSFNGIIAYAVEQNLDGANGWASWRWLFFIEGIVPMAWGFVVIFFLPRTPETVMLGFSEEEKEIILKRSRASHNTGDSRIRPKLILQVLIDPQFWLLTIINSGVHFCTSSLSNFLPDILHSFGWTTVKAEYMTIIVYGCAICSVLLVTYLADRFQRRGPLIIACCTIAAIGYVLVIACTNHTVRFIGACIIALGALPNSVMVMIWVAVTNVGYTHRASAAAMANMFATVVGIAGNKAYNDPPIYRRGNGASLGMISLSAVTAVVLTIYLKVMNQRKLKQKDSAEAERLRQYSVDEIGNRHPDFYYGY